MIRYARSVLFSSFAILSLAAACAPAQAQSPAATARATIAGRTLQIDYSAPSVRGRQIFGAGGLLSQDPTYPIWRAGANAATTFKTDGGVALGDLLVPTGTYTLYVDVSEPDAWELVVSRQTGQWGLEYDAAQDLGRVKMTMSAPPSTVEALRYVLEDTGNGSGELRLEWEHHTGSVPITAR